MCIRDSYVDLADPAPGADPLVSVLEEIDIFKRLMAAYPEKIAPVSVSYTHLSVLHRSCFVQRVQFTAQPDRPQGLPRTCLLYTSRLKMSISSSTLTSGSAPGAGSARSATVSCLSLIHIFRGLVDLHGLSGLLPYSLWGIFPTGYVSPLSVSYTHLCFGVPACSCDGFRQDSIE